MILFAALTTGGAAAGQTEEVDRKELLSSYIEEITIRTDGPVYLTGDYLRFSLMCTDKSSNLLSPLSKLAYVELLDQNNVTVAQEIIQLEEGKGYGDILLPFTANSGNYILRAYTRWMRNFSPEGYSHRLVTIVNPFKTLGLQQGQVVGENRVPENEGNLSVKIDKPTYSSRQKVTAEIDLKGENGKALTGLVSFSASKVPAFLIDGSTTLPASPISSKTPPLSSGADFFLPETRGQFITGKVYQAATKTPRKDELIFLSVPGLLPEFFTSKSDEEGNIAFEIIDFFGSGTVYFQSADSESDITIELVSAFSKEYAKIDLPAITIDKSWVDYLTEASQNMQVRNVYTEAIPQLDLLASADTLPFYGLPDQRYFLDEYTRFPLMEEVLREYIGGILLRKRDNGFYFKMVDLENDEIMSNEPLMLYDGLPVKDADKIVEIDPRLVKRIDVISRRYLMGDAIFNGITSFHTYKGDLAGLSLSETDLTFPLKGVQKYRGYNFPSYEGQEAKSSPLPDFRNTLFWMPEVAIVDGKAIVEFYTADTTGDFMIEVSGISSEGAIIQNRSFFEVKK